MARSRRPKPGATQDFNEGIYHRPPLGLSFFKTGVLVADRDPDPHLLRVHEGAAVEQPRLHRDGDVPRRDDAARDGAGADRRRQRRRGDQRRGRRRQREGHVHRRLRGPAAPRRRPDHDPPAPVPRAATSSSTSGRAARARPTCPTAATSRSRQTATAVQLDQVLTALQAPRPQEPRRLPRAATARPSTTSRRPAMDVGMDPEVQGLSGAEAINQSFDYGGKAGKSSSQVSQALLGEQAGDLRGLIKASAQRLPAARQPREPAQRPDHELLDHDRRARRRVAEPPGHARRSSRRPSSRRSATCRRSTPPSRRCAPSLAS